MIPSVNEAEYIHGCIRRHEAEWIHRDMGLYGDAKDNL